MNNIKERGNKVEAMICGLFNISNEEYMEMWYEAGCKYAENLFYNWALRGIAHKRAVNIYIRSNAFWYFWAKNWLKACEQFIEKGLHTRKAFDIYVLNAPEPDRALHREIVRNSTAVSKKETNKFYEKTKSK